jgi:hypothetical protein
VFCRPAWARAKQRLGTDLEAEGAGLWLTLNHTLQLFHIAEEMLGKFRPIYDINLRASIEQTSNTLRAHAIRPPGTCEEKVCWFDSSRAENMRFECAAQWPFKGT